MYKIVLANGTELNNLELNGNNFISNVAILDDVFVNNLETVTITNEDGSIVYSNMKLVQNQIYGNESWFILAEKTKVEIEKDDLYQLMADLTEVLLMGGV